MRTRRLINDRGALVEEMLEGYTGANGDVIALSDGLVVRVRPKPQGFVGLVIANGSGHEPAMIGWVGRGLLDVNVPGPLFSSPGPSKILTGIREADRGAGVLLLVSSHAGDIMNASIAITDAEKIGLRATMVVLYDDVASAPREHAEDRRGGPGLFFVWKIVGALAERGASLDDCAAMAARVRDRTRSISVAIGSVTHPISGQSLGTAGESELLIGGGVHGEAGALLGEDVSADELAGHLISRLVEDAGIEAGSRVALLVNNAGSLTLMELSILYRGAQGALRERGIDVSRSWIGSYATTLDQAGFAFAISVFDPEVEELYDAPAHGAGFIKVGAVP
jgi:dihydroxyacetone kinase-like protein